MLDRAEEVDRPDSQGQDVDPVRKLLHDGIKLVAIAVFVFGATFFADSDGFYEENEAEYGATGNFFENF